LARWGFFYFIVLFCIYVGKSGAEKTILNISGYTPFLDLRQIEINLMMQFAIGMN
jgi:hypothetical protein